MVYVYGEESMIVEFTFGSSSLFVNKHNEIKTIIIDNTIFNVFLQNLTTSNIAIINKIKIPNIFFPF